jgi:DNA-binding CsgD family transcriptional regulator
MTPTTRPKRRSSKTRSASPALERGREAYERRDWQDAFVALSEADREHPLEDQDLECLAWAAGLTARIDAYVAAFERLHDLRASAGEPCSAARAAFWLGMRLLTMGEIGHGTAWLSKAERLIEGHRDCAERGYLMIPRGFDALARKNAPAEARDAARQACEIGDRLGDPELGSLARMLHGQALAALGEHEAALALLDESMLAATRGQLRPLITGLVYCGVIGCCQRLYAVERAREWTAALDDWCRSQPQLGTFTGACRVHRSEILQLQGAWQQAIDEARRATQGIAGLPDPDGTPLAFYQEGELLRLRGEFEAAETAYRSAHQAGKVPQPGLALLRLATGQTAAAAAAIRQVVGSAPDALARARYLPAAVEILLAAGEPSEAEQATRDLEAIARAARNEVLDALASHARGAVRAAQGDAQGALEPLRRALSIWRRVGAPYLAARVRVEIASALTALADQEGARLERDAARAVFAELEAAPDLARLNAAEDARQRQPFGLTPREREVLRLLATGRTNRAISEQLFLSEKTIDRHVSNIFTKLDVSSRAAATAFAYRHQLL